MTTAEITGPVAPQTPVVHPVHGIGLAIRMHGQTHIDVQWPGVPLVRREHVTAVRLPVADPEPVRRPRRRRTAAPDA